MDSKISPLDALGASLSAAGGMAEDAIAPHAVYTFECLAPDGSVRWREEIRNTVVTVGKNSLLDVYFRAQSQIATWYVGLISSVGYSAIAAADTMASHAGWTEAGPTNAPNYSQAARPTLAFSAASAGSMSTSSAAAFSITATGTVKGGFITSVATKDGTTGTLYSAGLFTGGDRAVINGDTINFSVTLSA
jgi:hypothetical protein